MREVKFSIRRPHCHDQPTVKGKLLFILNGLITLPLEVRGEFQKSLFST